MAGPVLCVIQDGTAMERALSMKNCRNDWKWLGRLNTRQLESIPGVSCDIGSGMTSDSQERIGTAGGVFDESADDSLRIEWGTV